MSFAHPILDCEQAQRFERALLKNEACEWAAMRRAGYTLAEAMLEDWRELGGSAWRWAGVDGACAAGATGDCQNAKAVPVAAKIGPRVLVLVGKGHNGGDALLAAAWLASRFDQLEVVLYRTHGLDTLRPLCRRAWDGLFALARSGLRLRDRSEEPPQALFSNTAEPYVFCIDGLLGMRSRPPLRGREAALLEAVNAATVTAIGLRAAVDLPSGLGDPNAFRADFTYATGIAKRPAFASRNAPLVGRLRYLDIGFFADPNAAAALAESLTATQPAESLSSAQPSAGSAGAADTAVRVAGAAAAPGEFGAGKVAAGASASVAAGASASVAAGASASVAAGASASGAGASGAFSPRIEMPRSADGRFCRDSEGASSPCVLTPAVLDAFRQWRSPFGDKRHHGHLFVLGGSAQMPGALLMNVQSALRSGVGLVTAFAPQSVAAQFAAQAPEAMWVPWPETDEGTLALEGQHLLATRLPRATALLMGSGMGRSAETLALLEDIARTCDVPLILDADALQPSVLAAAARKCRPVVITPHIGEFLRLCPAARRSAQAGDGAEIVAQAQVASVALRPVEQGTAVAINDIGWADALRDFCREHGLVTVLKGVQTRVADAQSVSYSLFGGPVLARGGSGDVLAGLLGGCLVQRPGEPLLAAQQAVCWHGLASQALARECGQVCVTTMDLVRHIPGVIRG